MIGKGPDAAIEALELTSKEARPMFRVGMVNSWVEDLGKQKGAAWKPSAAVKKLFDADTSMHAEMRTMFPDDMSFQRFLREISREATATSMAKRSLILIEAGAFILGGTSLLGRLAQ